MKARHVCLSLALACLLAAVPARRAQAAGQGAPAATPPFDQLVRLFDYDPNADLDVQETKVHDKDRAQIRVITYASPKGGRVTAYLVTPKGAGPFAGIVFLHRGQDDKSSFLAEALLYARAGAVSLLIDAPFIRPAPWTNSGGGGLGDPGADREMYTQTVVDVRRGLDLLAARRDVDPKRIGYVGHSFGATWGGVIAGVEKRFRAHVLMAGYARLSSDTFETQHPTLSTAFARLPKEALDKYIAATESLDAIHYIGHAAPAPILFQFARFDIFISEDQAKEYERAASQPRQTRWYDTGHELNDLEALRDRSDFLTAQLGLNTIDDLMMKKLHLGGASGGK